MSVPPVSSAGSADSSDGSELEGGSDSEGVWEDGSEELAVGSGVLSSCGDVPPLHAVKENTSVIDSRSGSNFFILAIPFLLSQESICAFNRLL